MSEDNQAEEIETSAPEPKPEPLFTLDLGTNGGVLAPTSYTELSEWLKKEINFWSWNSRYFGNSNLNDPGYWLEQGRRLLNQASQDLSEAEQFNRRRSGGEIMKNIAAEENKFRACQERIRECYVSGKFPYSSTPIAQRIHNLQKTSGEVAAILYGAVYFHPTNNQHSIYGQQLPGWRGLVEGLIDRHDLIGAISEGRQQAAEASFEQLRNKAEQFVAEKGQACDALHRDYADLTTSARQEAERQITQFGESQTRWQTEFDQLKAQHHQDMEQLRRTFNEGMGLRAPALYWKEKQKTHGTWSKVWGVVSFLGIVGAAGGLGFQIHDLLKNTPANTAPETWRLAVLALVAVFTVWGVRLIVRLFLSHQHLYTDAQERITMVQTYLSLMEGEHLASRNDRQLILQALFRPASDGLVKDEGVPFSLAEVITRQGKS